MSEDRTRQVLWWRGWPAAISVLALLVLWYVSAKAMNTIYFPGPWSVALEFYHLAKGRLLGDVWASVKEAFGGWVIGSLAGIAIGTIIGRYRSFAVAVKPLLNFLRHISPLAWVPLCILWFGIGYWSKASIVVLIAFFNLVVNTAHGVSSIDEGNIRVAQVFHLSRSQKTAVFLMSALPDILVGLRFAIGLSWGGVIIAELVAGTVGIGALELFGGQRFNVAIIMVGMVTLAIIGVVINWIFLAVQQRAFPWLVSSRVAAEGHIEV